MTLDNIDDGIKERKASKGLESILADFYRLTGKRSEKLYSNNIDEVAKYYEYIYENLNSNYSLLDVEKFSGRAELDAMLEDEENSSKIGLFISAALNKVIRNGEKVSVSARKPINYLCYKLKDAEAYLDIAGDLVGCYSENSKIHIKNLIATDKKIIAYTPSKVISGIIGFLIINGIVLYHLSLGYGRKNTEIYLDGTNLLKRDDLIYKKGEPLLNSYINAEYRLDIDWNLDKKKGNKVFLYEEIYNQHPLFFRVIGLKKYKKEADLL